uniref:Major facilitator superfamily (MFS) profile domain-containing protein n=1 Tax=Bionectria ochroleuca TaxID=29856 RepID=A0A8H7K1Y2_BIOOC
MAEKPRAIDHPASDHVEKMSGDVEITQTETLQIDSVEIRRLLRKIDLRLLPLLTVLYVLSFMDRSNIGNARVAGMNTDLALTGPQYNMALTVFFFPYALFEVPSNVVLKMMRPSRWMCILVIIWGTVLTLQGIVKTYEQLLVTRIFLGVAEAGFFPAATYILTTWYCRWEYQTRVAIFFSAASLAGSFSGLLAFGIQHMEGIAGLGGWRWIFILEGILTVLIGVIIPWALPDSPETASFLTQDEKTILIHRLRQDAGTQAREDSSEKFQWKYFRAAFVDYEFILVLSCIGATAPNIIRQLGYSAANAQLLTIPIYLVGAIATYGLAKISDRRKARWPFVIIPFCISGVGLIALLSIPHPRLPGLTYAFLFCIPAGLYPAVIGCISWVSNNLAPSWKRAIGMAFLMTLGSSGGAVGANIFLDEQAPRYPLAYGLSLGVVVAGICAAMVLRFAVDRTNAKRDAIPESEIRAKYTEEELHELGDSSPMFRYVK